MNDYRCTYYNSCFSICQGVFKINFKVYVFAENNELNFVNLKDKGVLSLSFFEFACDLASLKTRGWLKKEYIGFPINQIRSDLSELCRFTTVEILIGFLKANGKDVLEEITEASLLASDHVDKYLTKCYDRTDENKKYIDDLLSKHIQAFNGEFNYNFMKVNDSSRGVTDFENLTYLLYFDFCETAKAYRSYSGKWIKIKKCQNCGRYFVVKGRSDKLYCDYPSPQNLSFHCNDPHMLRFYGDSETEIEIKKRRHRIFTTWQTRLRNHPEDTTAQEIFENFKTRDAEHKLAVENGSQTESQYYEFLINYPTPKQYKDNPEQYTDAIKGMEED